MAGPIALAAALSNTITLKCPWCGYRKLVAKGGPPVSYRVCPKCKRHYPDPRHGKRTKR